MKATKKALFTLTLISLLALAPGTVRAVVETFDTYPLHTNSTHDTLAGGPGDIIFWIYGNAPTNSEIIASWSEDTDVSTQSGLTSAGIATNGTEIYAFGAGGGDNPGIGYDLAIMDFGMHDWGMTSGVIADF